MNIVIVGQGYVGLPLAQAACRAGLKVRGLDLDEQKVNSLNAGHSTVDDLSDADVAEMLSLGYRASSSPLVLNDAEVVVICVPTPLGQGNSPDLGAVLGAAETIATNIKRNALVVLESTTYPGTTAGEVAPILNRSGMRLGHDLFLAFSPERIDPGNQYFGIANTPKVVGADDPVSLEKAVAFYESFVDKVVPVSGTAEAELTKLLENTYRHINIGLVNELAVACHELDIDIWEVIRAAATKPFGFQAFYPGPGVGGHCIPIDPNYLGFRVKQVLGRPFRFVELAQDINASMPAYVVSRAQDLLNSREKSLKASRVLLLGVSYKAGISDTRESPASDIGEILLSKGVDLCFYDPNVHEWRLESGGKVRRVETVSDAVQDTDLVILLQEVPDLDVDFLVEESSLFLDTRGVTSHPKACKL